MDMFSAQVSWLAKARGMRRAGPGVRDDVVEGAFRHLLYVSGPDGVTREQAADALDVPERQVRRVARRMAGEVFAVREGFGAAQTTRYSFARPLYRE